MPLWGMMRVKNEERWVERSLRSMLEVCETVFVLNDHSTDKTTEIIHGLNRSNQICLIHSTFADLNEGRDKTYLLSRIVDGVSVRDVGNQSPHWVICVDGDEEIYAEDLYKIKHRWPRLDAVSYSFQILTLRNDDNHIRVDGIYSNLLRPSMFRLIKPGMRFMSHATHGGGFHCSNVPADIGFGITVHEPEPVRVLHYGYMEKEDRERKYKFYLEHDPGHKDWYWNECYGEPVIVPLGMGL